ncbi:methionine adenosyltransferase [Acholeplasma sp. OttesenSCG-928-E16]|nr:methionine adenosyltransferase [Acholeplasma sp. OttesenSCG-928-E16]
MKIITSEQVFKGHPDKICDQISDAILDECLKEDANSRVAIETLIKNNLIVIAGEVTTNADVNYQKVTLDVLEDIGYEDLDDFEFIIEVSKQSPDIALGVDKDGAGDQGIMYGYACSDTKELMPLPIFLARRIAIQMDSLTRNFKELFGRDGKCQVSVRYDENDKPVEITNIIVSQQTKENVDREFYTAFIINECLKKVIPQGMITSETKILINPTGEFVKGGSYADCGLTGRKIICDTYGGVGRHGGGAFSGKDATKVDRSAAYYCRYVAKNIVASGLASKCEVQVAYAIGVAKPTAVNVDTFGTGKINDEAIKEIVLKFFNFQPLAIKTEIISKDVSFRELAEYGHVGREDVDVPWERCNKAYILKAYTKQAYGKAK